MIVVIRDIEAATSNAAFLTASGINAVPLAVLSYTPILFDESELTKPYQAIIFTSKHGILNRESFFNLPAWCIGNTTAKTAEKFGYTNVIVSSDRAQSLVETISNELDRTKGPLLWSSGLDIAFDIEAYLKHKNFQIQRVVSYQMKPVDHLAHKFIKLARSNKIKGVIILSKRNFYCFRELMIKENIWEFHKNWQLFTFKKIPFTKDEVSSFAGTVKSNTASFEHLFKSIKNWYSTCSKS